MMVEFADAYINPFEVATIRILDQNLLNTTEVLIGMTNGEKLRDVFPDREAAEDFVEWIALTISPELEADDDLGEEDIY